MAKIARLNGDVAAFASTATGTNRTIFGALGQSDTLDANVVANWLTGWEIVGPNEFPDLEDFNGALFTVSQLVAYLHQIGVPEYQASQEYQDFGIANEGGVLYISQSDSNTGNTPSSDDGTDWVPLLDNSIQSATITPGADANVTLTFLEYTKDRLILVDGSWTVGRDIIVPDDERRYFIDNSAGTFAATVKTAAGTGVVVQAGESALLICDGTNVVYGVGASFGYGQTWQDFTASRASGVLYTNTSGRTIAVDISAFVSAGLSGNNLYFIGSVPGNFAVSGFNASATQDFYVNKVLIVPPGETYKVTLSGTLTNWQELR